MWKEKTATRRAESRQRELMPAAKWISEERGGRAVNVTRGATQMFAGSDDPSSILVFCCTALATAPFVWISCMCFILSLKDCSSVDSSNVTM